MNERAEQIFRDHVNQSDGNADLEALVRAHPEHAVELRDLHEEWALLCEIAADETEAANSSPAPGSNDPRIAIGRGSMAWSSFLERLRKTRGTESPYRHKGELARGGMGAILRVFDENLRRDLAMKVILPGSSSQNLEVPSENSSHLARFLEEAQVTAQLSHPGIVPVHELGIDDEGRVFFTMQLVAGEDLHQALRRVRSGESEWTKARLLSVLLRVCETVAFAHASGVVHRDLKPSNIMVGPFGETYVMDWGLARVLSAHERPDGERTAGGRTFDDSGVAGADQGPSGSIGDLGDSATPSSAGAGSRRIESDRRDLGALTPGSSLLTLDGEVLGTPAYMSPEQANGQLAELDTRADVYAMGAILYEVLSGRPPYAIDTPKSPHELLLLVRRGPPQSIQSAAPDSPEELLAICHKAMARERHHRYSDMNELAGDLRAFLEGRVVTAHRTGPWVEFKKWVVRNRLVAGTIAASLIVIACVVAFSIDSVRSERDNAVSEREKVLRLSDLRRLIEIQQASDQLWPARSWNASALKYLFEDAEALVRRRGEHEQYLGELRKLGTPITEGPRTEATLTKDRQDGSTDSVAVNALGYRFDDTDTAWLYESLRELLSGIDQLRADDPYQTTLRALKERHQFAADVERITLIEPAETWSEAIAAIADPSACPEYDGLRIRPMEGLIPMGPDPTSGLWEFWHVQSGDRPQRGENGRLVHNGATGLVFVLVPGGTFHMGSQALDPDAPNYDPDAEENEQPVNQIALAPFLLSKTEMTQGQWQRATGSNPSYYLVRAPMVSGPQYPIESISHDSCSQVLRRLGLTFPTEAQWEYACRAGSSTPWFFGESSEGIEHYANVADRNFELVVRSNDYHGDPFDDLHALLAPAGTYEPNAFGLHEMTGNLYEWCRDVFWHYSFSVPAEGPEGIRPHLGTLTPEGIPVPITDRPYRGGCFSERTGSTRSALRTGNSTGFLNDLLGVRPSAALDIEM